MRNYTQIGDALRRADQNWSNHTTHVDAEAAFMDRRVLAEEVIRLRRELQDAVEGLTDAEREIERLFRQHQHYALRSNQ